MKRDLGHTVHYPSDPFLMLTLLRQASRGATRIEDALADIRRFVQEIEPMDPESLLPARVDEDGELHERLVTAARHLEEAGLLTEDESGRYAATDRGRHLFHQNPKGIDDTVLEQFVEFRRYLSLEAARTGPTEPSTEYRSGFAQYHDGLTLADNPFEPDTARYYEWNAGWFEAFEEMLDHSRATRSPGPQQT